MSEKTQVAVSVKNLQKEYGELEVLKNISVDVLEGQVVSIIGPSGSGKSTLLRCLNYLEEFAAGEIAIMGNTLNGGQAKKKNEKAAKEIRKSVGMVFQQFNLWPHKTVLENVIEGPVQV